MERESFIFGNKNIPIWFEDQAKKGRISIKYENGEIQKATIMSGTKRYEAFPGDTIIHSKTGMVVIHKTEEKEETANEKEIEGMEEFFDE